MSTGIGTLKPSQRRSLWPAAVVLSLVMLTVAVIVFSIDRGGSTTQAPPKQVAVEAPAGIEAGTAANTPSELRGAITTRAGMNAFRGHIPRDWAGAAANDQGAGAVGTTPALGTNTPTEISGGLRMPSPEEIQAREQRRP